MRPEGALAKPVKPDAEVSSVTADPPPGEGKGAGAGATNGALAAAAGATLISLRLSSASNGQEAGACQFSSRWQIGQILSPERARFQRPFTLSILILASHSKGLFHTLPSRSTSLEGLEAGAAAAAAALGPLAGLLSFPTTLNLSWKGTSNTIESSDAFSKERARKRNWSRRGE